MYHLESLIAEYLVWQGYLVQKNKRVGKLAHGGYAMELDVVGYNPHTNDLVHYEASIDALSWTTREERYQKKFGAGRTFIKTELFSWLPASTPLRQIAVFISHPKGRDTVAGGQLISIDEFMATVRARIVECGPMISNAIPEQFPLLRTLQMALTGYFKVLPLPTPTSPGTAAVPLDVVTGEQTITAGICVP